MAIDPASGTDNNSTNQKSYSYPISTDNTSNNTSNGTKVVKKNNDIDKNMFLKILSAELANQDPTSSDSQSSTQYISQLAQFSSLEQMANLNSSTKMGTANSLMNKYVTFSDTDDQGNNVSGQVVGVIKDGDDIELNVLMGQEKDKDGNMVDKYEKFNIDDAEKIVDLGDTTNFTVSSNMLLNATSLIGKKVNLDDKDSSGNNYSGVVQSVSRLFGGITVKVKLSDGSTKDFDFKDVSDVENS
ncbi:flagellar hook capping FlgD N-terminal domain-containing protein [Clostridium coskatii]|uniref:Basal-body rod modification protein FlgD n=1 Tax=Clostridium coskatii TaxID=1705578 RepID=A0A162L047_9CLOT|nr:flagellar hook capping FlgD N-terminal domain-containing protein [Clostridium coskatii]OAA89292.1 flagellar basal body rod modification protein [Clostridium coskatii]OBR97400.1 flagellar basal body rod modification protein [Clostridium coskatii]